MLAGSGVRVSYGTRQALAGVELTADPGRVLGLIGPNGSGKTTLLRAFLAAVDATGTLLIDDTSITELATGDIARRIAFVSQHEEPFTEITVAELVLLGRSVHRSGWANYTRDDHTLAYHAMDRTGILDMAHRPITRLSGGERQRVLIARALAQQSPHLLLDEPTNHLDVRYQHEILGLVHTLGLTTIIVLHDLNLAGRYCDDLILLDNGQVAATGTTSEVLRPEIIEPVYHIGTQVHTLEGIPQLLFTPHDRTSAAP